MTLSDVILTPLYWNATVLDGSILRASFINGNVDVVSSDFTPECSSFCPDKTQPLTSLGDSSGQGIEMTSRTRSLLQEISLYALQMTAFVKLMAERLADRWSRSQSAVKGWLRARIAFSIIRASSMCLRGSRKKWRCSEDLFGFVDGAALSLGLT
uniref:Oligopeptide transporter 1 n=1 Tax=Lygus hesperus TaxID=30085 RepID=A0A0A9VZQ3_LYGHE